VNRGKIDLWDVFRLECVYTPDTVDLGAMASGSATTYYINATSGLVVQGIALQSYTDNPGPDTTYSTLDIPDLGVSQSYSTAGTIAITSTLDIETPRLDVMPGGYFRFSWTDIKWYVNAALQYSHGAGSMDSVELGPAYWPLIGVSAQMVASGETTTIPTDPPLTSYTNTETKGQATVTGGWKKKLGADWTSFPVNLIPGSLPIPDGCGCSSIVTASMSASDTSSFSATGYQRVFTEDVTSTVECDCPPGCTQVDQPTYTKHTSRAGWERVDALCVLIPDFTKSIERWQDQANDFRAFIERSKMPRTQRIRQATCVTGTSQVTILDGVTTNYYQAVDINRRQSEIISVVGETTHAIEDTLSYATYAPRNFGYSGHIGYAESYVFDVGSGRCIVSLDCAGLTPCFEDTYHYCLIDSLDSTVNVEPNNALPVLDTVSLDDNWRAYATYANTWASPHWSFGYHIEDWEVLGSTGFWSNYWGRVGSQWLYNSALPVFEQRRTRNSIIEAALEVSPFRGYQTSRFGWRFLGISRFYVYGNSAPSSVVTTSASSAGWTGTDCSLAHAASIAVTPTTTTPVVEYDIGNMTAVPYMYPHIANQITLNWSGANITSVSVKLVSADGTSTKEIATSTGTKNLLSGTDTKYAGSWAIDNGAGWITDLGYDDGPHVGDGESSTVMSDVERIESFSYLKGYGAAKLRFEFTLSSTAAFTLNYPTWRAAGGYCDIARESRQNSVLFLLNTAVRYGNLSYTGAASPPVIMSEGRPTTVNDYICWQNHWWQGKAHNTNINTIIGNAFDSTEGNTYVEAEDDTMAIVLPKPSTTSVPVTATHNAALINTIREVPPMAMAARKERDENYAETGGYVLQTFCFAQEPRRFITAGTTAVKFEDPVGTVWSTVQTGWPTNWSVTDSRRPVDNNEGYGYITQNNETYGRTRGWSGNFSVINFSENDGTDPFNHQDNLGRYKRVHIKDGIVFNGVDWSRPYPGFDRTIQVTSDPADEKPRLFEDPLTRRIFITFTRQT